MLAERFAGSAVFFDVTETIPDGEDFVRLIEDRISTCDVLLAIIGPGWNPAARGGARRLDHPNDVVRLELRTGLESAVKVIPVLVAGAAMPAADDVPEDIRRLTRLQAVTLEEAAFDDDASQLLLAIERSLSVSLDAGDAAPAAGSGILRLDLVDVYGQLIAEPAQLLLRSRDVAHVAQFADVPAGRRIVVRGLVDAPSNHYLLDVTTASFRPVQWVVESTSWKVGGVGTIVLPLNPSRVAGLRLPEYAELPGALHAIVENGRRSGITYESLDPTARATLLNLVAGTSCVRLPDGATLADRLTATSAGLRTLRTDRMTLWISTGLAEEIQRSVDAGFLGLTSGALHIPPDGYSLVLSAKTPDQFLRFQVTLFARAGDRILELEFDDGMGLGCIFRSRRDPADTGLAHPCDVHQLLCAYLRRDPGYRWEIAR